MTLPLKPLYPYVYTTTVISKYYITTQAHKPEAYLAFVRNTENFSVEQHREASARGEFVETGIAMIAGDELVTQWKFEEFGG